MCLTPRLTKAMTFVGTLCLLAAQVFAQHDPGVRGGFQNTAGMLEYRGIPIPHPPVISANPTTGGTINPDELASFQEGIKRAGQLESTYDNLRRRARRLTDGWSG